MLLYMRHDCNNFQFDADVVSSTADGLRLSHVLIVLTIAMGFKLTMGAFTKA